MAFCFLTALYCLSLRQGDRWRNGLPLGLLLIKPSLGVPAALIGLFQRSWKGFAAGATLLVLLSLPFLLRQGFGHGVESYVAAVERVAAPGGDADESRENPRRFDLISLQSWLASWAAPAYLTAAAYLLISVALAAALFRFRGGAADLDTAGLYWTLAAAFFTLVVYHRVYDAAVLLIGVASAVRLYRRISIADWLSLALPLAVFSLPGSAMLRTWFGAATPPWFEAIVVRHPTPAILLLAAACVRLLLRHAAAAPGAQAPSTAGANSSSISST